MGRLDGKIAFVTGAANGMGYATTQLFVEEGATVIAVDVMAEALQKWEGVAGVVPVLADITQLENINRIFDDADARYGGVDIVCNVAGINDLCYTLEDTTDERYDKVFDLDVKAPFRICRRAVKSMEKRGGGAILNIGSYAGVRGNHGPSYTAAKAALIGLTRSVAVAYAKKNIRCNIVNPGGTNTEIGLHSGGDYHAEGMGMLLDIVGKFPIKFYCEPIEIARAALWLCCDESKHITGAVVPVDGGMSAC